MMSSLCPLGHSPDTKQTAFGQCLDVLRTPRARTDTRASRPDPTRPDRSQPGTTGGSGLHTHLPLNCKRRTDPVTSSLHREVWHHLTTGLASISLNDWGRDWPAPDRRRVRELLAEFDADLCRKAAHEAREIVVSQDRAPNITGLFEKKLRDLAEVRATVRDSLGAAA